jgi:hypothetical protein
MQRWTAERCYPPTVLASASASLTGGVNLKGWPPIMQRVLHGVSRHGRYTS